MEHHTTEVIVYKVETIVTPYVVEILNDSDVFRNAIKRVEDESEPVPPIGNPKRTVGYNATKHTGFPPPDYFYAYNPQR